MSASRVRSPRQSRGRGAPSTRAIAPSTATTSPVTYRDGSLAKKSTTSRDVVSVTRALEGDPVLEPFDEAKGVLPVVLPDRRGDETRA